MNQILIKPVYEFLLWDNCNNNCKFCWQRGNPRLFNLEKRKKILDKTVEFIKSDKFIKGSHILIVGGEIFDKPSDFEYLSQFFDKIIELLKDDTIDLLYINTNLIYNDLRGVDNLLNKIKQSNLFERLRFTTSYDLEGRFKTDDDRRLMLSNLEYCVNSYKDLQVVTNVILTKQACDAILTRKFNSNKFMKDYRCWINFIPYIIYDKELSAERGDVFKTLLKVDKDNPGYLLRYVTNLNLKQDRYLYSYKDDGFNFCSSKNDDCGHSVNFKKYSESGKCFICDLNRIFGNE